jgi:hypothetical protein
MATRNLGIDLSMGRLIMVVGSPDSGKTSSIETILKDAAHQFRWYLIFNGSKSEGDSYQAFDQRFVHEHYDEEVIAKAMKRQRDVREAESAKGIPKEKRTKMFIVIDDMLECINTNAMTWRSLITKRRHLGIVVVLIMHYVKQVPPLLRSNDDYLLVFQTGADSSLNALVDIAGNALETSKNFKAKVSSLKGHKGRMLLISVTTNEWAIIQMPRPSENCSVRVKQ